MRTTDAGPQPSAEMAGIAGALAAAAGVSGVKDQARRASGQYAHRYAKRGRKGRDARLPTTAKGRK